MRVAYVNADCGIPVFGDKGGAVHIREMVRAFCAIGCDVKLLSARLGAGSADDLNGIVEYVAPAAGTNQGADPADRSVKERSHMRAADAIEDRLLALNEGWPIDVIYERYSLWSAAGVRAAKKLGIPVILEVNAPLLVEQQEHRRLALADTAGKIEREVLTQADTIAVVSQNLAGYVSNITGDDTNISVVANGVDTARFNPAVENCRAELGLAPEDFVVGFTGSLKNWHGVDTLLRSFASVRRSSPDARLLIVGDGPKKGWIEGFAEGAGIADSVLMTGWVDHEKLPPLVACMDVATAPYPVSDNSYFSPLKLYEYLAMGRPIVASDIGQTGTVIEHEKTGLLAPPGDVDALADSLLKIHKDQQLSSRLAAEAAKEGKKHSWINNAKTVLELTRNLRRAA